MTASGAQRAIVVGGGIAGLVTAWELARAGVPVSLLEASDQLGGQVRRQRIAGIDVDAGAEAFATRTGAVAQLATELGLGADIVTPSTAGAWLQLSDGSARPLPATSLLGIPASPLDPEVRAIIGRLAAVRASLDRLMPASYGADSRTLGELVRRRMGVGVVEKLVAPVTNGVHSAHPDELAVTRVAPGLLDALLSQGALGRAVRTMRETAVSGSAVAGIRGGMARLVDELHRELVRLGADIQLGTRARSVHSDHVQLDTGPMSGVVVVAAPGVIGEPESQGTVVATLVLECGALDSAPRGSGVLVAGDPRVQARALTHQSAKWQWLAESAGGRHVVRLSYERLPAEPQVQARQDAEILLGVPIAADWVDGFSVVTWDRAARKPARPELMVPGVFQVGEEIAGTGLAAVVAQARTQAAAILDQVRAS